MKKSHSIKLVLMTLLLASCAQQDEDSWDDDNANNMNDSTRMHHSYYTTGWYGYPFIGRSFYRGPYIYSNAEYYSHGFAAESPIARGGFGSSHTSAHG